MLENIGWVFEVVNDSWTELQNTDQKYKDYISDIIKSHDDEGAEISGDYEINLKKNYYLTKTIDNDSSIIYIDKPVDYILNPDDDRDYDDENYYKSWKENLRSRLNEISSQQGGIGANDFERWIKANEKLYLVYYIDEDLRKATPQGKDPDDFKDNIRHYYATYKLSPSSNQITYTYYVEKHEKYKYITTKPKSIIFTYDKKNNTISINFEISIDGEAKTSNYKLSDNYINFFNDNGRGVTSFFRGKKAPDLKKDLKFVSNNGKTYRITTSEPTTKQMNKNYYHEVEHIVMKDINNYNTNREALLKEVEKDALAFRFISDTMRNESNFAAEAIAKNGLVLRYASDELRNNNDVVMAAVNNNGMALEFASDELRNNKDVVEAAVNNYGFAAFQFASTDLYNNADVQNAKMQWERVGFVLAALKNNGLLLRGASGGARNNYNVVKAAVNNNGLALEFASEKLRGDRDVVLAAVENNGMALEFASETLRGDRDVVEAAVENNGMALLYASETLRGNEDFVLDAVKQNGLALEYASEEHKKDWKFVLSAVNNNGLALRYASEKLKEHRAVVEAAVNNNGLALQFASETLRGNEDFVLDAVKQNGLALEFASDELRGNKDVVEAAVNNNELARQFASDKPKEDTDVKKAATANAVPPAGEAKSDADAAAAAVESVTAGVAAAASITSVTATPAADTNMTTPNNDHGFLYYSKIENDKSDGNWIFLKDDAEVEIMGEIIDKYKDLTYYKNNQFNISPHFFPFKKNDKIYIFIRTPTIDLINSEDVNISLIDLDISPEDSPASSPLSHRRIGDTTPSSTPPSTPLSPFANKEVLVTPQREAANEVVPVTPTGDTPLPLRREGWRDEAEERAAAETAAAAAAKQVEDDRLRKEKEERLKKKEEDRLRKDGQEQPAGEESVPTSDDNTTPDEWDQRMLAVPPKQDVATAASASTETLADRDKAGGGKLVKIKFGNKKNINKSHDTGIKFIKAKKPEKSKLDKHLKK